LSGSKYAYIMLMYSLENWVYACEKDLIEEKSKIRYCYFELWRTFKLHCYT